ncbi:CPBP family intramembrane glutamic endopeptidase [Pseudonocardia hierapolitana]|uniref:CPBP family intramembrane glutamic endopeptidase n=1 Tax=Pseudonocardia hierapolitana TaxID=1128676 RepID=UPI001FE59F07|nr:CPBP family intramembrane glutamic endopeptidase [Pseudonocardia hierapolitana]
MGAVHRDGRPGSEEPGPGSGGEDAAAHAAAAQHAADPAGGAPVEPDPGADPTRGAPTSEDPPVGPAQGSTSGAVPASGPTAWDPPAAGVAPALPAEEEAPTTVGVAASPAPPPVGSAQQAGAPWPQPGYAAWPPPPAPGPPYPQGAYPPGQAYPQGSYPQAQPYPPGPYPPAAPYPAPSIGRQSGPRSSWGAPSPVRKHRWGLGAYLLAEAVFLLTSALIGIVLVGDAGPTATTLAIALSVPTVLAASTALLITWVRGNGPIVDLGLVWSWRDLGMGLAFGFGGLALTIPASIVYVAIVGEDATSAVGDVFGGIRAGPALAALVLVIVVFVAPMCEEILYRGLLWGGIEKIAGRWVAFAVSTLLFAIAHFEFTRTPLLLVVAIPIAIARLYTGRLLASIVAHQINNLLPGIALVLGLLGVFPMT